MKQDTNLCLEMPEDADDDVCASPPSFNGFPGDDRLLVATLYEGGETTDLSYRRRLSERTVFFIISDGQRAFRVPVITDYAGRAVLGNVALPPGTYTVDVYFNGQIPLDGGQTVTLADDRYWPAMASSELVLENTAPIAVDDHYDAIEGVPLTIDAPGVLANDSDIDIDAALTAILVSGPSSGDLVLNPDGSFTYTPDAGFYGVDAFTYKASDGSLESNLATVTITVNEVFNPCETAYAMPATIWPPDKKTLYPVEVGVTDSGGNPLELEIVFDAIWQDEPVGNKKFSPDAEGIGTDTAWVRAERDGNGDGRVYHLFFTATDAAGVTICTGEAVSAIIPHDQGNLIDAVDGGALYDSTIPD
jgi:hypothetical protein